MSQFAAKTAPAEPTRLVPQGAQLLSAVGTLAHRELLRQFSKPANLLAQALQMVFLLLVYAVGFNGMVDSVGEVAFSAYVFPGLIAVHIVSTGVNAGLTFAWDREYGFMRELLVAPVPRWVLPVGKMAGTTAVATAHSAALLLLAPFVSVRLDVPTFAETLAACAAGAAAFCAFGLLLAASAKRIQTVQSVVQLALFPMLFLSGSVFRPDQSPGWLSAAVQVNPMSYAVDLLRQALLASADRGVPHLASPALDLLVLLTFAVLAVAGTCWRIGR